MEHKNIVATIYIKDGMAVKSPTGDIYKTGEELVELLNK